MSMTRNRLPEKITRRLTLPLIAAPMLAVSGPELAIAACVNGVIGAFGEKRIGWIGLSWSCRVHRFPYLTCDSPAVVAS